MFLDNRLSWEAQSLRITRKVSQKIRVLLRAGQQLTLPAKRTFYILIWPSLRPTLNMAQINAFYSSLSTASKEKLIRLSKHAWCPSNFQSSTVDAISSPLPATLNLPPSSTMDYKLLVFTYRCTHSLTSTLLTNEFSVLGQSNALTHTIYNTGSIVTVYLSFLAQRLPPLWYNLSSLYLLTFVELSAVTVFSAASSESRC